MAEVAEVPLVKFTRIWDGRGVEGRAVREGEAGEVVREVLAESPEPIENVIGFFEFGDGDAESGQVVGGLDSGFVPGLSDPLYLVFKPCIQEFSQSDGVGSGSA